MKTLPVSRFTSSARSGDSITCAISWRTYSPMHLRRTLFSLLFALMNVFAGATAEAASARVLIIVGPSTHPPGTHEVAASGRLLKHCVEHMEELPGVKADIVYEWPLDKTLRDAATTVILLGDTFPAMRLPDAQRNLAQLGEMMSRGCGMVCVHYSTGLRAEDVAEDGEHPLLHWTGGYFATKCKHHQSVAKIFPAATIAPAAPAHPVSRGWREFTVNEEPYYNNFFGRDGNRLMPGVTALATSMLPPEAPKREVVAWSIERRDGGRGFGIVMPHFYRNWKDEDLRRFILNGVVWTAKLEVPTRGVKTTLPDLETFAPESIEPKPRPTKANAATK
jgi:type 1 glutamine amidotransferase